MDKSKFWSLLLYASLLLALGGVIGHFAGDALCAAQGNAVNVVCEATGGDNATTRSTASGPTLHNGFALPAAIAWAGWQHLVFLALVFTFRPVQFSLLPSPPPPKQVS